MSPKNALMLEVKNLSKDFGAVKAVKDLDFQVDRGEVFGFLGPNGAGKTTTMRIITCYMPATAGTVLVDGMDAKEQSMEVRRKIGYLPENAPLYNDMNVTEYLTYIGNIRGIRGSRLASRMDEMFQICSLKEMARREIGKLSKGYRQRVGLAQALIHDPELLILDEPTTGLDPNQIVEIRQLIKSMGQKKTVIYCSHILPEVSATCSRILIINAGKIVATGTPDALTNDLKTEDSYVVKVKGPKEEIQKHFSAIAGVSRVKFDTIGSWLEAQVSAHGENVGEDIYRCVSDNKWSMSELRRESASLEDAFTKLTRG